MNLIEVLLAFKQKLTPFIQGLLRITCIIACIVLMCETLTASVYTLEGFGKIPLYEKKNVVNSNTVVFIILFSFLAIALGISTLALYKSF